MVSSTGSEAYYSVSTIKIKPGKAKEVQSALDEVAADTFKNEPGAKIYRAYKVADKDEFVCIEK
jgi:quinol monooxygenase YgiN